MARNNEIKSDGPADNKPAWKLGGVVSVSLGITTLWATNPGQMSVVGLVGLSGMWAAAGAILQKNSNVLSELITRA